MKIAYIIPSLEITGGAEKIIIEKANYLSGHFGFDVSIITQCHHNEAPIAYPLYKEIHHINLGIPYYAQYKYKYPKRIWIKWKTYKRVRKETTAAVLKIDPDILISLPFFKPDIAYPIPCRAKKIIEFHEPIEYHLHPKFFKGSWVSKLFEKYYFQTIVKDADVVVGLTNDERKHFKIAKRLEIIPNFSSMDIKQYSTCNAKRVISVGRLTPVKGLERLLKIWKIVNSKHPDWHLDIFGNGSLKNELIYYANENNIKNIILRGIAHDISQEYANSSIFVLSSYYEGFSLVILEAMMHGVPCIAFDCPNGPRSIIQNNQCGFLIEDGDNSLFAEKLCELIENQNLRKKFSTAAIERSKLFNIEVIMKQWKFLFESLLDGPTQ